MSIILKEYYILELILKGALVRRTLHLFQITFDQLYIYVLSVCPTTIAILTIMRPRWLFYKKVASLMVAACNRF